VEEGLIVVGVPGLSVPVAGAPLLGVEAAPGVVAVEEPAAPGVRVPVVVDSAPLVGVVLVAGSVIVVVIGAGVPLAFEEPLLRSTNAAASTPRASIAIAAMIAIGVFQLVGAASRVRAAAPQCRHHSCSGFNAAPHSGQTVSTGGKADRGKDGDGDGCGDGCTAATALTCLVCLGCLGRGDG
jgi:hypothetical protein